MLKRLNLCIVLFCLTAVGVGQRTLTVPEAVVAFPELIIYNGKFVTMDDTGYNSNVGSVVQAMAVREGRILALGTSSEIRALAGPETDQLDVLGKTVIPGIVDPHVHIHDKALSRWLTENPGESRAAARVFRAQGATYAELKRSIEVVLRERLPSVEEGKWVFLNLPTARDGSGKGVGTGFVLDRAMSQPELDELSPKHPILVAAHPGYLVNSKALEAVEDIYGFDPEHEIRDGGLAEQGVYYRRGVVIDGYLRGRRELLANMYVEELNKWAAGGVTTFSSHIMGFDAFNAYMKMRRENRMPIRFGYSHFAGLMVNPHAAAFYRRLGDMAGFGDDWLWQSGVGAGSIDSGPPAICTSLDLPAEAKAREICRIAPGKDQGEGLYAAIASGQRVAIGHAYGDLGVDQFMDMLEKAIAEEPGVTLESVRAHRMTTDHCGLYPRPDQIPRMKKLGIMLSCGSNIMDRTQPWLELYGQDKANWISPVKSALEGGVKVVMEHEGDERDYFVAMVPFMTRTNKAGIVVAPEEAVDRITVMKMATSWSAEFMMKEDVLGTLEKGKLADFVVLNKDFFQIPQPEIASIRPLMTVVDGKTVFLETEYASQIGRQPVGAQLDYHNRRPRD